MRYNQEKQDPARLLHAVLNNIQRDTYFYTVLILRLQYFVHFQLVWLRLWPDIQTKHGSLRTGPKITW